MINIPFISTPDKPLIASTQDKIPVADITEDLIIYKNGGASLVLESTSLNFGLLSTIEQEAVIAAYAALLNSFTFPVQITVRSKRKDISNYLKYLDEAEGKIKNPKLAVIMKDYKTFIEDAIRKKNVLSKNFYIIIPFTPYELGATKSFIATAKRGGFLPFPKSYVVNKARITLYPKRDHLMRQAGRLSIVLRQLKNNELIELLYQTYNPTPPPKSEEFEALKKAEEIMSKNQK